jgi:RNA polymerase sigma-70 factor (ECF subfamily)
MDVTLDNQEKLITLAKQGDQVAFTQLVVAYQNLVRGYIGARTRYAYDVDDLAQETFILAFKKLIELQKNEAFGSWLCSIALNLVRNHYRKFSPTTDGNNSILDSMITERLEHEIEQENESISISALKNCIEALSNDLKKLLTMHYQHNQSIKSLTETFQVKHSTITMRLHRTRAGLRQCILDKLSREES